MNPKFSVLPLHELTPYGTKGAGTGCKDKLDTKSHKNMTCKDLRGVIIGIWHELQANRSKFY